MLQDPADWLVLIVTRVTLWRPGPAIWGAHRRLVTIAFAMAIIVPGACVPAVAPPSTPAEATPSGSRSAPTASLAVRPGGCDGTVIYGPPGPALGPGLADNPWTSATPEKSQILAVFWGDPPYLAAGGVRPHGEANKVLWIVRGQASPPPFVEIRAHNADTDEAASFKVKVLVDPADSYSSLIDLPSPGCWVLDVTAGDVEGRISVDVASADSSG